MNNKNEQQFTLMLNDQEQSIFTEVLNADVDSKNYLQQVRSSKIVADKHQFAELSNKIVQFAAQSDPRHDEEFMWLATRCIHVCESDLSN